MQSLGVYQACNQLGTPGGAKCFLRGAKFFKLCPTHFQVGGKHLCRGGQSPPGYGPGAKGAKECLHAEQNTYFAVGAQADRDQAFRLGRLAGLVDTDVGEVLGGQLQRVEHSRVHAGREDHSVASGDAQRLLRVAVLLHELGYRLE